MSINAVDLIDSMIMIDPMDRLGTPGSKNDIRSLMNHPFFTGIDFNNIHSLNILQQIKKEEASNNHNSVTDKVRKSALNVGEVRENPNQIVFRGILLKKNKFF